MQIKQHTLIEELLAVTRNALQAARAFKQFPESVLRQRPDENFWNILECFEHLNLYGDFYLPEIEKKILSSKPHRQDAIFTSGLIGNYFVKLIRVQDGTIKKMKTTKDKDPVKCRLSLTSIDRLIKQLERLIQLLNEAKRVDLVKTKTNITLTRLIRLRLGDTLRFVVYHIQRHLLQASKIAGAINFPEERDNITIITKAGVILPANDRHEIVLYPED